MTGQSRKSFIWLVVLPLWTASPIGKDLATKIVLLFNAWNYFFNIGVRSLKPFLLLLRRIIPAEYLTGSVSKTANFNTSCCWKSLPGKFMTVNPVTQPFQLLKCWSMSWEKVNFFVCFHIFKNCLYNFPVRLNEIKSEMNVQYKVYHELKQEVQDIASGKLDHKLDELELYIDECAGVFLRLSPILMQK